MRTLSVVWMHFRSLRRLLFAVDRIGYYQRTTRQQLLIAEMQSVGSLSQAGPKSLWPSLSNYVFPVASSKDAGSVAALFYFLDSGGGTYQEVVSASQAAWFTTTAETLNPSGRYAIRSSFQIFASLDLQVLKFLCPKTGLNQSLHQIKCRKETRLLEVKAGFQLLPFEMLLVPARNKIWRHWTDDYCLFFAHSIPELVFFHIPTLTHQKVGIKPGGPINSPCVGSINLEVVAPQIAEWGLIDALSKRPSVKVGLRLLHPLHHVSQSWSFHDVFQGSYTRSCVLFLEFFFVLSRSFSWECPLDSDCE